MIEFVVSGSWLLGLTVLLVIGFPRRTPDEIDRNFLIKLVVHVQAIGHRHRSIEHAPLQILLIGIVVVVHVRKAVRV